MFIKTSSQTTRFIEKNSVLIFSFLYLQTIASFNDFDTTETKKKVDNSIKM